MVATLGLRPLDDTESMGGIDMSSFQYYFAYESLRNGYNGGADELRTVNATKPVILANLGEARGDHTFVGHGLTWSPFRVLEMAAHYIDWKADADLQADGTGGPAADLHATEWGFVARVWLWGPRSGIMGGSEAEGGIATSPRYSVIDLKDTGDGNPIGEVTNLGWGIHYYVPGGWLNLYGFWDRYECDQAVCHPNVALVSDNDRSFNTLLTVLE